MKNRLFWEKHRPKNINDVVLLPRIKKSIQNGVTQNLLMYGGPGCGKTTLSRIIAKLYPEQEFDKSFVNKLSKKLPMFKVGGEKN